MSIVVGYLGGAAAIFHRDARVFASYRARALGQFTGLIVSLAIFYYVSRLIATDAFDSPDQYFAFVATGLLTASILQAALSIPGFFRQELVAGTFERALVSPLGPIGLIFASLLFPIALSVAIAVLGFAAAALLFDLPVTWSTAPLAIPVAILGAAAFSALAVLMVASVVVFKQSPGVGLIFAAISLTAGVYFPVDLLPDWIEWMSSVQPFTPAVDLLRHLLIGTDLIDSPALAVLRLVGFTVVLVPVSFAVLRLAIRVGRQRGTLLEY